MKYSKAARPVMMGQNGMVSSGHALASLAGVKVLQEGGNAVDAALAAAFVMAVVKPEASGPGGDLFALVFIKKTGKVEALNSSGPAPAKATIDYFRARGLKSIPQYGPLSIAVPGAVDGWLELHKKYATKDLSRLMVDAIGIARAGLPISQDFAESIEEFSAEYPLGGPLLPPATRHAKARQDTRAKRFGRRAGKNRATRPRWFLCRSGGGENLRDHQS